MLAQSPLRPTLLFTVFTSLLISPLIYPLIALLMLLDQIQLSYLLNEDRILLRIGFADKDDAVKKQEVRIFITRRLLQQLWPMLMQTMATQVTLDHPGAAFASQDIVQMEYQQSVNELTDSGGFTQSYSDQGRDFPLGETPLLLDTIKFHLNANQPAHIQLFPATQGSVDLHLTSALLHGFCKLLQDTEQKAQWGLTLALPDSDVQNTATGLLN